MGIVASKETEHPTVSVVIATYNWSSVLRLAMASVLEQTFADLELLVVGDGCTDDTEEVVRSFEDRRVQWHNLPENSGHQSVPNNYGIDAARGRYVAYLGHDDLWHPKHLEALVSKLEASGADFAHSLGVMIGPEGSNARVVTGVWPKTSYERGFSVPPSTVIHSSAFARRIGGWRVYRDIEEQPDIDFLNRAFDAGARFARVEQLTVFKFNSSWRKNSYVEKPSHEQAEYLRRIRSEPDFIEREWLAIARIPILELPVSPPTIKTDGDPAAGWLVDQYRKYRGLAPGEVELEPYHKSRIVALSSENETLRTACRDRLEALEKMTAEYQKVRAENDVLRTACEERLRGIETLAAECERLRSENEILRTACEERLRVIDTLAAELREFRK